VFVRHSDRHTSGVSNLRFLFLFALADRRNEHASEVAVFLGEREVVGFEGCFLCGGQFVFHEKTMHAKRAVVQSFFCLFFLHTNWLPPMRSAGLDIVCGYPLTSQQRPELDRLTVKHRAAGIDPLGFFFGREDHFSRLPG